MNKIQYIDGVDIENKKILLRVDYNVSLSPSFSIADDERIRRSLPTIEYLLKRHNKLILLSHLGRPDGKDPHYSLKQVAADLQTLLPSSKIIFIEDFTSASGEEILKNQKENEIILLENLRFLPGEKNNDPDLTKALCALADVFVNDAFGVAHRKDASVVGIPRHLPSYGGLLLKKEVGMISKCMNAPQKPYVAIIGGAKISGKIHLLDRLIIEADTLILGGGIANTMLKAHGHEIGISIAEEGELPRAKKLLDLAAEKGVAVILPVDVVVANAKDAKESSVKKITEVSPDDMIVDVGPETEELYKPLIAGAQTIVWNGPFGYFENPLFRKGTDFIYEAITQNGSATSIVGGGQTLAAISKKEGLNHISHISTGGGAMLELIASGTLPGLEALSYNP